MRDIFIHVKSRLKYNVSYIFISKQVTSDANSRSAEMLQTNHFVLDVEAMYISSVVYSSQNVKVTLIVTEKIMEHRFKPAMTWPDKLANTGQPTKVRRESRGAGSRPQKRGRGTLAK